MQDFTEELLKLKEHFSLQKKVPMIELPANYPVLDLSNGPVDLDANVFAVAKYAEHRPGQYISEIYKNDRDFHIGLDIIAPVSTDVFAPYTMKILETAYLPADKDYGHCLLGQILWPGRDLFILVGHLAKDVLALGKEKTIIEQGESFAKLGSEAENGGWFPHIHVQFSFLKPEKCDMPGVIRKEDNPYWRSQYPDPRILLGELYRE